MRAHATPVLAILASPPRASAGQPDESPGRLPEDRFCRELCLMGAELGLYVYVVHADPAIAAIRGTDWNGYVLRDGQWALLRCPLPDLIYDRAIGANPAERRAKADLLEKVSALKPFAPLNGALPGKLAVYEALRADPRLRPALPPTYAYTGAAGLRKLIARFPDGLFLKPDAGYQGRGAVALHARADGWLAHGRTLANADIARSFADAASCAAWCERFVRAAYIAQPYLPLRNEAGASFDIRSLMQKDERGRWRVTGIAVREGAPGSITSNLHGGGEAKDAEAVLAARFGAEAARRLLLRTARLSLRAARALELRFGRFFELGLDFGLEPSGRLWLIEANAKPGRMSFRGRPVIYRLAVLRPLQAALLRAGTGRTALSPIMSSFPHRSTRGYTYTQQARNHRGCIQEVHP
ncbi:YheC/YheD family protein [Paenibacillus methanolicus]|uniref:YheC/D-like protein n=1 Tax=Paenibacillus methanolicus TaxID=582686 RepID=A0A5S5BVG4_9BACL|nr:YheC/YheD family protein [Paenibacillus methanolicus]TYP71181.1 YheC/D-like protein [Paenibacillus methanolicus]